MAKDKSQSKEKITLSRIKEKALSRGLSLAKMSASAGAQMATHAVGNLFATKEKIKERNKAFLVEQAKKLALELGQLKGTVMKAGQSLSMLGEYFLPKEANEMLKSLQKESPPLVWSQIKRQIEAELSPEQREKLEIEEEPMASASLGQVHKARIKDTGEWVALKIQYPGVSDAIGSDLKTIRRILSMSKLLPKGEKFDELFDEVRQMLEREVDYRIERESTNFMRDQLKSDSRFIVPKVYDEFSTRKILATEYVHGTDVDSLEVLELSIERRNQIGLAYLELFFREFYQWGAVQTDPHFGNYRIQIDPEGKLDRLVLLDFGAVRKFTPDFLQAYYKMAKGAYLGDPKLAIQGAKELHFIRDDDSDDLKQLFYEVCSMFAEPFSTIERLKKEGITPDPDRLMSKEGVYDWGESDLPKRAAKLTTKTAFSFKLRPPPPQVIFLDRKLGGVFIFLSVLRVRIQSRELLEQYLIRGV